MASWPTGTLTGCGSRKRTSPRQETHLTSGHYEWGHTITPLLGGLTGTDKADEDLITCAKVLDKHYIPTRCPNGLDSGAPADF